eukprot:TRINITY_DN4086_c0_g2_i1.p1 TRINITY_DN4086_c0_g2~~TRINITY_DN4086_c0_g2_i1.p1  ORF type:complete len:1193 (-),score=278.09 TRINITY_DN4086_c0_g2_i1:318-3896(-)
MQTMRMSVSKPLWTVIAAISFVGSVHSQAHLMATVDLHSADETVDHVNGTIYAAGEEPVKLSRVGLMTPSASAGPLLGMLTGTGFPATVPAPKDATTYMEITFTVSPGGPWKGVYIYATVAAGLDAPATYAVASSLDGFATVTDTFSVPLSDAENASLPAAVATNVTMYITTTEALPEGAVVTVRMTASSAPLNATSPNAWFGVANHAALGRMAVYAVPYRCPIGSGNGCIHGTRALRSFTPMTEGTALPAGALSIHASDGMLDHGRHGTFDCTHVNVSGNATAAALMGRASASGWGVLLECWCDCYHPDPLDSPYDACVAASMTHAYAGNVCPSVGVVATAADVAMFDACDTIDGDLTIDISPPAFVVFPRVRRVNGTVSVQASMMSSGVSLPLLEHCAGLNVGGVGLTTFEAPRLRDVCGGGITFGQTRVPTLSLPMLGRRPVEHLDLAAENADVSLDIGSVMGGPTAIHGAAGTAFLLRLDGRSSTHITSLVGLTALQRVLPAPGADSGVEIAYLRVPPKALAGLRNVEIGGEEGEGRDVRFDFMNNDFSGSGGGAVVELNGLMAAARYEVSGNAGLQILRTPRVCGASWRQLSVANNPDLTEVDIGSVSGGPLAIECETDKCPYIYSTAPALERIDGLTRLRSVLGPSTVFGTFHLRYAGVVVLTSGLLNATYGTGVRSLGFSFFSSTLPETVAFPGVTELRTLSITNNDGMTSLRFPNLAGEEMGITSISSNVGLTHVDLGSVGGGPSRFYSTSSIFTLSGRFPGYITSIEGLWRTTAFIAAGAAHGRVIFERWKMDALPASLLAATYDGLTVGVDLKITYVTVNGGGEVVFSGAVSLPRIEVSSCSGATAWRFPRLAPTMTVESLKFLGNTHVNTLDFGSVSGGPRTIVGISSTTVHLAGRIGGQVAAILGLDQVQEVSCAATGSAKCHIKFEYLDMLPMSLITHATTHGQVGTAIGVHCVGVTLSSPTEVAFPNLTKVDFVKWTDTTGMTALRLPNWNADESLYAVVDDNADLHTVDFGSVGGGPVTLTGNSVSSDAVFGMAGKSTQPVDTLLGLSNLTTIRGWSSRNNVVTLGNLGADASAAAQALLGSVTFDVGAKSVALVVKSTAITELRVPGATALLSLEVRDNAQLTVLRFPAMPTDGITGNSDVHDNALLSEICATDLDPLTAGAHSQTGNMAAASCPA